MDYFKKNIVSSMKKIFGEVAASVTIDILKYDPLTRRAILRVPSNYYSKLHSALTLCGQYEEETECCYKINKTSPLLLALNCDSRSYIH